MNATRSILGLLATALFTAACSASEAANNSAESVEELIATAPSYEAPSETGRQDPSTTREITESAVEFPPPGVPLIASSEFAVGDLAQLRDGGRWMYGVRHPSTLVRVDPDDGSTVELDIGLGESPTGSAEHVVSGGSIWVLGGPFRDTLVRIDPETMREIDRVLLEDDHSVGASTPLDALWILSLRLARPVDPVTKMPGDAVDLPVDPVALAAGQGAAWVSLPAAAQVARIDAETHEVTLIDTEPGPSQLVLDQGVLWVAHSPTATISRIDPATGEVLGVTDVDVSDDDTVASVVTGLRPAPAGLWATVRFDGSPHHPVLVHLDGETGAVTGARSLGLTVSSSTSHRGELWLHRPDSGTLVQVDVDAFADGDPTAVGDLAAPTTAVDPIDAGSDDDPGGARREVRAAFDDFVNPAVEVADLAVGDFGQVREDLVDLLDAQVGGTARVTEIVVDDDFAMVVFDVVVEGETVILPGVELGFTGRDGEWTVEGESLCVLAAGVGVACSP